MAEVHDIADRRQRSTNVTDIHAYSAHLMVVANDGPHVIPRALIEGVIAGRNDSSTLTESVVRRIIEEWLEKVTT